MTDSAPPGRGRRLLHLALWTALFYALAAGIAKLLEWLNR